MRVRYHVVQSLTQSAGRVSLASFAAVALLIPLLMVAACGSSPSGINSSPPPKGAVNVAYAGSLVNLMEHKLGPAFQHDSGYTYQGKGAGSTALANQIKSKLISPDVFISASAGAYSPLEGAANGNIVSWYMSFAATAMVIGYSPKSSFASQFQAAASGTTPWYQVLESSGLRLGRTDPALDPKGVNTLFTMQLAEKYYQQPGLAVRILGANNNPAQIFPEETLVARLGSGELDAGFFYRNEVKDAGLPFIELPAQINLGDPSQASYYAQASYTTSTGQKQTGKPILYSITIPSTVKNLPGAEGFVAYLLGDAGKTVLTDDGITRIPVVVGGDASKIPSALATYVRS